MQDFTKGPVTRQVIRFTAPIMLSNVLMSVYGIINLIWVGRLLGHEAVAAVSASLPIIMLLPAFLIGLSLATNVMIAQSFGLNDMALIRKILANSFLTSLLLCLLISLCALLFRRQLLAWVGAPEEIMAMALSYLTVMMGCLVFQFCIGWMNSVLRGLGDAAAVVKILVIQTLANILFVPLLISGAGPLPPLGVTGAAWGTALAALFTCFTGYLYLLRVIPYIDMRQWDFSLDWCLIRQVFVIGIPASLQMMVVSLSGVIIIALVNRYGTAVTAAFGIGMQVDMLAFIPYLSVSMAATTIVGQNLGARRMDRVFQTVRASVYSGLIVASVTVALLLIFPQEIGAIFLKDSAEKAQVLELVRGYFKWMAFIYPCLAVVFAIQGVLRGAGDTMALLALSFLAMFVIRIPLAYFLAGPCGFRQDGIWIAMLFSNILAALLNWLYYVYGPWKKKQIFGNS
ncbi:MAG: MATE family efflux transporter, partial [Syntrophaceae bacterium]|nr:MATE family efflux transporter [Syntrophaceae bacterium]